MPPLSADLLRGHTDTIILAQLMEKDSYGYEINRSVQQRTKGACSFKEATLYTAFKRLETAGFITSYWGEDGPGARRRYYAITDAGRKRWSDDYQEWQHFRGVLDALISLQEDPVPAPQDGEMPQPEEPDDAIFIPNQDIIITLQEDINHE